MTEREPHDPVEAQLIGLERDLKHIPVLSDAAARARSALRESDMDLFVDDIAELNIPEPVSYSAATFEGAYPFEIFTIRYDLPPLDDPFAASVEQVQARFDTRGGQVVPQFSLLLMESALSTEREKFKIPLSSVRDTTTGRVELQLAAHALVQNIVVLREHAELRLRTIPQVPKPNFPADLVGQTTMGQQIRFRPRM